MLQAFLIAGRIEAGCDEAGRGCLAGPVTAAAVILPPDFHDDLINDSKQLTERQREQLRPIIEREAVAWAVAMVSPQEIDRGNRFFPFFYIPHTTIVKGDGKMLSLAAASILAKTHRDELMCQLDAEFPQYGWARNKGYPTPDHRAAIAQYGATPYHRHTFQLLPQPTLFDNL